MEALDRVVLRRRVPATLLREHVHDDGAVELGGIAQRAFEAAHVVTVERTGVADAEILEEGLRLEVLAQRGHCRLQTAFHAVAHEWEVAEQAINSRPPPQVR